MPKLIPEAMRFAPSLIQRFLILVSIPLCFEVGLVALLLDMQAKTEIESQRLDRAKQINSVINQICRDDIKLEDVLDTTQDPLTMARQINQYFSDVRLCFEKLEVLTRPDAAQHALLVSELNEVQSIHSDFQSLKASLIVNQDVSPIVLARQYAPKFKHRIRTLVNGGFLSMADNYASVVDADSSVPLRQATKKLLQLAVLISIFIAISSSAYVSQSLAKRLRRLAENARRLGNREFLIAEKNSLKKVGDELTQVDMAMQEAAQAIATLDKIREEIIGMVSHDIRSPVTTIKMAAEMLEGDLDKLSVEDSKKMLVDIGGNCDRILSISRDLLDLHRWEAGALTLDLTRFQVQDVIANAMQAVRGVATKRRIQLSAEGPDLTIVADGTRLEQILTNLLTNAIKNSPPDSIVQVVSVLPAGEGKVRLEVRDQGPGLPPGLENTIFERFVQGRDSDRVKGIGLGLAIARALTELHKGQISAANLPGKGSVFAVTLPLNNIGR